MHQTYARVWLFRSRISRFYFNTDKALRTDFVRGDDVTIPHALCIEKNIVYYVISFRDGWYGFRKPQCGDPERRIALYEINSIRTDKFDGYIIFFFIIYPPMLPLLLLLYYSYYFSIFNIFHSFWLFFFICSIQRSIIFISLDNWSF